jgi:hypothetical protein
MAQRMITAAVKAAIKEAIKTHPDYAAERIVGLVFEASPALVRETAKEIGHSWPKPRKGYIPKSYAPRIPPPLEDDLHLVPRGTK